MTEAGDKRFKKALNRHRAGKLQEAGELYLRFLRDHPAHLDANYLLGTLYAEQGVYSKALDYLSRAAAINPASAMVQTNLGNVHRLTGRFEEAVRHYQRALAIDPRLAEAHYNLGNIHLQRNEIAEAERHLRQAIALQPGLVDAHLAMAEVCKRRGDAQAAIDHYQTASTLDPRRAASTAHLIAALKGDSPPSAPPSYTARLFDSYAGYFESHLVKELGYDMPHRIRTCFAPDARFARVLDLGCGTGLCGELFRDAAAHLIGVDIAPRMIAEAKKKGLYDQLVVGDLEDYLQGATQRFDLIIAADVLVYVGALDGLFARLARAVAPRGQVVFTTERHDGTGWRLLPTARYAHGMAYVEELARAHGFSVTLREAVPVRKEAGEWVQGDLFILAAPGAPD